jgi:putative ABC transport system ATP-binding protein
MEDSPLVELSAVSKSYGVAGHRVFQALKNVNLAVHRGEFLAIVGRSGSGKSTLLNLIAGIDPPDSGTVAVGGHVLTASSEDALAVWRGRCVGIVFQFFQLIPTLTVLENVLLAMDFVGGIPRAQRRGRALDLLKRVDILDQANKLPATLSGGQQQRAAIARALANDPQILVADEPTGNLDTSNAAAVLDLFEALAASGRTVIVVTHDEGVADRAHRIVRLSDGEIAEDSGGARAGAAS